MLAIWFVYVDENNLISWFYFQIVRLTLDRRLLLPCAFCCLPLSVAAIYCRCFLLTIPVGVAVHQLCREFFIFEEFTFSSKYNLYQEEFLFVFGIPGIISRVPHIAVAIHIFLLFLVHLCCNVLHCTLQKVKYMCVNCNIVFLGRKCQN